MIGRRDMAHEEEILQPAESRRYCAPAIRKRRSGRRRAGLEKESLERRLAIFRVSADVGEVGAIAFPRRRPDDAHRVDAAVKRHSTLGAEPLLELDQRPPAGKTQHESKSRNPAARCNRRPSPLSIAPKSPGCRRS